MKTKIKVNSKDLITRINEHIEELAQATDEARFSEQMLAYLESCARFHQYSPNNLWLIRFSNPYATHVAGFNRWKQLGRYVKKGEPGIPILAPCLYKENANDPDSPMVLNGFKTVYVFDISQTDGKPLPPTPEWKSLEQNLELQGKLVTYAEANDIAVEFVDLQGGVQGVSKGGSIAISHQAGTKTLIHEIAHELMHRTVEHLVGDTCNRELEAEAVAYVVAKHFGIGNLASPNYVALHGATAETIRKHVDRIQKTASSIIRALE